jgi:Uma2 family endonuclease
VTVAPILPERREWTVDDLAELPSDLHYELINGRLLVSSPTALHQEIMGWMWTALRANCPPEYRVVMDLSVRVNRRNEPRPDVVVIPSRNFRRLPAPVDGVILAVEIASPDSTLRDMHEKFNLYADCRVPTYWVIDPSKDDISLTEFKLAADAGRYEVAGHTTEQFVSDVPWAVTIDLPAFTAERDALFEQSD